MAHVQDPRHPTGVSGSRDGSTYRARRRKAAAALELRHQHCTWEQICETLGYPNPRAAIVAVEQALADGLNTEESKEFMRMLAGRKMEELLFSVWGKATDSENPEHLHAVGKARELLMDHAKLMGYVSPAELAIYNPLEREIEELVGKISTKDMPEIEQGDIFEMEENSEGVYEPVPVSPEEF